MESESTVRGGASSRTPGPDEVYCRDCGSIIKERAEICPECGVRQRSGGLSGLDESGIAAIASLLIPGAGQIFLGHIERGLLFIAGTLFAGFLSMFIIGIPFLIGIWIYAIYDAYKLGEDPTRASRVWGGEPGATPIVEPEKVTGTQAGSVSEGTTDEETAPSTGRTGTDTDETDTATGESDTSTGGSDSMPPRTEGRTAGTEGSVDDTDQSSGHTSGSSSESDDSDDGMGIEETTR